MSDSIKKVSESQCESSSADELLFDFVTEIDFTIMVLEKVSADLQEEIEEACEDIYAEDNLKTDKFKTPKGQTVFVIWKKDDEGSALPKDKVSALYPGSSSKPARNSKAELKEKETPKPKKREPDSPAYDENFDEDLLSPMDDEDEDLGRSRKQSVDSLFSPDDSPKSSNIHSKSSGKKEEKQRPTRKPSTIARPVSVAFDAGDDLLFESDSEGNASVDEDLLGGSEEENEPTPSRRGSDRRSGGFAHSKAGGKLGSIPEGDSGVESNISHSPPSNDRANKQRNRNSNTVLSLSESDVWEKMLNEMLDSFCEDQKNVMVLPAFSVGFQKAIERMTKKTFKDLSTDVVEVASTWKVIVWKTKEVGRDTPMSLL
jgi:hypothetical protein